METKTQDQPANVATPETEGGSAATIGSASVVRVVRHGETESQLASRLVWWIATMVDFSKPVNCGDTVIEATHIIGLARKQLGLHAAIGTLLKVEATKHGTEYTIRDIEGIERRWTNAKMCLVEARPNADLNHGEDEKL